MSLAGLARGAAVNLVARAATVGLGLAVLVVVARMGPAAQGAFSLFVAVEAVLLTLCSGFGLALARGISHHGDAGGVPLRRWLRVSLAVGVLASLVLATAAALSSRPPFDQLGLLAVVAPLLLLVPTASGLWLGRGDMLALNAPQVAAPALVLCGLAALAMAPGAQGVGAVLVVWVAAKALVGIAAAVAAVRQAPLPARPPSPARGVAAGSLPTPAEWRFVAVIGLTNVVSLLNYRITLFLVERDAGLAEAGIYSVAVQIAELLWLLSSALTVSAYRRIGEPDQAAAARTTVLAARWAVALTVAAAPVLLAAAGWLVPPLLGEAYAAALWPLALLLPGVAAYAAASSVSAYFTHQLGRPHWAGGVAALSLGLNTLGCLWAVPVHGMAGAAVSTSVSYVVAIVVALGLFLRQTGLPWQALWRRQDVRPQ